MVGGPLAQLVEQRTFNPWVVGSSPTGPTQLRVSTCAISKGPWPELGDKMTSADKHSLESLDDLGRKFKTDKSSLEHGYLNSYEELIPFERDDEFIFFEIGVFRGSSARMWAEWFRNATVVGVDLKLPKLKAHHANLKLLTADATQPSTLSRLQKKFSPPSVILDDGSHLWDQQRESLRIFWPWLEPGGVYIIEDLHSSSEGGFSGGDVFPFVDLLLKIGSFLQLRDSRREHFLSVNAPWLGQIMQEVKSITFINSSAIITKRAIEGSF